MIRVLTHNLGWKLLSLVIAVLLWMAVVGDPEVVASLSVPVEFKNVPSDLEVSAGALDRVTLEVRGTSGRVAAARVQDSAVLLDLSSLQAGERNFEIQPGNVTLPPGVFLVRAIPASVHLRFERRVTRQLPVQVRFAGPPPKGYSVKETFVFPSRLTVVGPESRVQAAESALTDPVDISGVIGEAGFQVNAFVPDPQVRLAETGSVSVKVRLEKIH